MSRRAPLYYLIVAIIVAISVASIFYYAGLKSEQSTHTPTIDSWGIQSGTRYPALWINASDSGGDLLSWKLTLSNVSTLAVQYNASSQFGTHGDGYSGRISMALNCSNTYEGNFFARVVAIDRAGDESNVSERIIELPDNTPPLPEIVGVPWVWFDASNSTWRFRVNATDGDGDGLKILVTISYVDNWTSIYHCNFTNENNLTTWVAEDEVALPHGEFMLKAGAWDRAGWQSISVATYFNW